MKSVKKLLSLVLTLALIIGVLAVIPVIPASAAPGDVFEVTGIPDNWKWYSSSYVSRENNGAKFGVNADKGKGLDNYGILACNSQSADIIKANTTYQISLRIETWFTLDELQVDVDTGTALWSRTKSVQSITDLNNRASDIVGGNGSKLYATVTFNITTPAGISGNQHFVIGVITKTGATGGAANLRFYNIKITELGTYNVVDENGTLLDTVHGLPGDDVLTLVNASDANKDGAEIVSVSPTTIAADTTEIVVTYKKEEVEPEKIVVDFGDTWGGVSHDWAYIQKSSDGTLKLENGVVSTKTTANKGTTFGHRAVLLSNDRNVTDLKAGSTYLLELKLKTFTQWTPLESLSAEYAFGSNIYSYTSATNSSGQPIPTALDLASMVTDYSAASNGAVTFTLSTYITVPEAGGHMILSIYDGQWFLDEATFTLASSVTIVDDKGNTVGTVGGIVGDKTANMIPASLKTDADYVYTTSPEVLEDILTPIVLTKTLKSNLVQKINFAGNEYGGYTESDKYFVAYTDAQSRGFYKDGTGSLKAVAIDKGMTFGNRAVLLANTRTKKNVETGKSYRIKFQLRTQATELSNYQIDLGYTTSNDVWGTVAHTFKGAAIDSLVKSKTSGNTTKYVIAIDVTVPDNDAIKNVCLSVSGVDTPVTYWIDNAYIIKPSEAEIITYDETYYATVTGYEGDQIGEAVSIDGAAKFIGITNTFGAEKIKVKSNSVIYRGDVNADFALNADDLSLIIAYVVSGEDNFDAFGANANKDAAVNLLDVVRLKKILAGINDANLPATLQYDDYALAWNYEFDGTSVDSNAIGSTSGVNQVTGLNYVTVGEKNCVNVNNGILTMSPKYNYGNMLASEAFSTQNTMNFAYGYVEIRAKLPYSAANLPAIWFKSDGTLDASGNGVLEYDLLETFGSTTGMKSNVHCWYDNKDYSANHVDGRNYTFDSINDATKYHIYGFEWYYDESENISKITLYVDGVKQFTLTKKDINGTLNIPGLGIPDFDRPMYMILQNQAITEEYASANSSWLAGRAATEKDFPMDMCIDYIRIYQSASNKGNVLTTVTAE